MGHQHSGNYSAKHISGIPIAKPILTAVKTRTEKGKILCRDAHGIARDLNISPQKVGAAIDMCEARIIGCQLGLFGDGASDEVDQLDDQMPEELQQQVISAATDGRLTCIQAWQIADADSLSRMLVGRACDVEGIKITRCQLGTF